MAENYAPETICVQSGWEPKNGEPRVLPIYQSTTFKYETSEQMGKLFDLEESGYFYTRLQNPTNDYVAQKLCELAGGVAAKTAELGADYFLAKPNNSQAVVERVRLLKNSATVTPKAYQHLGLSVPGLRDGGEMEQLSF